MTCLLGHRWQVVERLYLDSPLDKLLASDLKLRNFDTRSSKDTEALVHQAVLVKRVCSSCGTEELQRI